VFSARALTKIKIPAKTTGGIFDWNINGQADTSVPTIRWTSFLLDSGFHCSIDRATSLIPIKININVKKRAKVYHSLIKGCHMGSCMAAN
jgi:hypothetical protein